MPMGPDVAGYAKGTLADVPLAHALVHARNRRLSGVLDLRAPDGRHGWIVFWRGLVVSAATTPPVARFGTVVYELGLIDAATLDATTLESAEKKRPQADLLLEAGAISPAQRNAVVAEQMRRRVHHLFTFPGATVFSFREVRASSAEPAIFVDPLAPLWRGIADFPPVNRVRDVLARVGSHRIVMISESALERADLSEDERELCESLARCPMTVAEMVDVARIPRARVEALVYLLLIARCAEPEGAPMSMGSGSIGAVAAPRHVSSEQQAVAPADAATPAALGVEGVRRRAERIACESPFETLGLPEGASIEAARAAFVRLARAWNPDRLPPELHAVRADCDRIFAHMTAAHHVLTDPVARAALAPGAGDRSSR